MARMPGALWRPVPNCTKGGMRAHYGVVLHIMEGTLWGSDAWFRNPAAQASSHFGVGKDGTIVQWVDGDDRSWAEAAGNPYWLSIEHEGHAGDSLTDAQIAADAKILAWAHTTYGIPLQSTDAVDGRGLGWHGMGGTAWGGHTGCPGNPIKAQRPAILEAAAAALGNQPAPAPAPDGNAFPGASRFGPGANNASVTRLGAMLVARGAGRFYRQGPGPTWGDADRNACQAFQQAQGWTGSEADGIPGPATWQLLVTGKGHDIPAAKPAPPALEPFPSAAFFHAGRNSPIITAMGRRLVAEGCGRYATGPGPNWTTADRDSYAQWQRKCGYSGSSADGVPGKATWDKLRVPKQ